MQDVATNMARPRDSIFKVVVTNCDHETEDLHVHRGVLCKSSTFFKNAMKPEWANSREHPETIDLSEDDSRTVCDYIQWLYSDHVPIDPHKTGEDSREDCAKKAEKIFVLLAEAYVFGEKIMDFKYKNAIVRIIAKAKESYVWNMGPESVTIIYNGTSAGCPLRRLIADSIAHQAHDDSMGGVGWMQYIEGYPREALVDSMKTMAKIRPKIS